MWYYLERTKTMHLSFPGPLLYFIFIYKSYKHTCCPNPCFETSFVGHHKDLFLFMLQSPHFLKHHACQRRLVCQFSFHIETKYTTQCRILFMRDQTPAPTAVPTPFEQLIFHDFSRCLWFTDTKSNWKISWWNVLDPSQPENQIFSCATLLYNLHKNVPKDTLYAYNIWNKLVSHQQTHTHTLWVWEQWAQMKGSLF